MGRIGKIARRTFLLGSAAVVGGVAFGYYRYKKDIPNPLLDELATGEAAITPYVMIDAKGVTLVTPRADVGQGTSSVQAHLLAEELDIDPHQVRLDPGPPSEAYYNGIGSRGQCADPRDQRQRGYTHRARLDRNFHAPDRLSDHRRLVYCAGRI